MTTMRGCLLAVLVATLAACSATTGGGTVTAPRISLLTPGPDASPESAAGSQADAATARPDFVALPRERLDGAWLIIQTFIESTDAAFRPSPAVEYWYYVATPDCATSACDASLKMYVKGVAEPVATADLRFSDGHYTYTSTGTATSCTSSDGRSAAAGVVMTTSVDLQLGETTAPGSAVMNTELRGTETITEKRTKEGAAAGCVARTSEWSLRGTPSIFVAVKPTPVPTPRPTPTPRRVTPAPQAGSGGGGGGAPAGPQWDGNGYVQSVNDTYVVAVPGALDVVYWALCPEPCTQDVFVALATETAEYVKAAQNAVNGHLAYMTSHPAATCARDAYAADRALANKWLAGLGHFGLARNGPMERGQQMEIDDLYGATSDFLSKANGYLGDC